LATLTYRHRYEVIAVFKTVSNGDKLISLSTCEYSRNNGRLVVVAKKISE
jgi:sortase B